MADLSEQASKQGRLWGMMPDDWVEVHEPQSRSLHEFALDALGVSAGKKFLDAGCGAGGASLMASDRGAVVSGFDASVPLLTIARSRVPKGDLRVGELENIPFPNGEFDAVAAINTVQFSANPGLVVHELGRVCAEGGRVAIMVWAPKDVCDMRFVFDAIVDVFPKRPSGEGAFGLSPLGRLEALIEAVADLTLERVVEIDHVHVWPTLDASVRSQLAAGGTQRAIEIVGEEPVVNAVHNVMKRFQGTDGAVRMQNRFRCAIARR